MQDGRKMHPPQRRELDFEGASGEAELIGNPHETLERRACEGKGIALAKSHEVEVVAMITRDHRNARKATFRSLRGSDYWQSAPAKTQLAGDAHARRPTA